MYCISPLTSNHDAVANTWWILRSRICIDFFTVRTSNLCCSNQNTETRFQTKLALNITSFRWNWVLLFIMMGSCAYWLAIRKSANTPSRLKDSPSYTLRSHWRLLVQCLPTPESRISYKQSLPDLHELVVGLTDVECILSMFNWTAWFFK